MARLGKGAPRTAEAERGVHWVLAALRSLPGVSISSSMEEEAAAVRTLKRVAKAARLGLNLYLRPTCD